MQKQIKFWANLWLAAGFLLMSFCLGLSYAQHIPHLIRYKGNIKELLKESEVKKEEAKEEKEKDGKTYSLTFRIYNLEVGGEPLWIEAHPEVLVERQDFEVLLGSITPLDLKFSQDYWLSLEIDGQAEIVPRQRMTSVGYAYMADDSWKLGGRYSDEYAFSQHSHLGEDVVTVVAEAINADTVDGLHAYELGGIKDHGLLEGLADDDHLQYLNVLRGDERYAGVGWDGLTKLKTTQDHIADHSNPHAVTLEQLGHLDNNPEEEAPTATERGEPTGTEIQGWADDILAWGHSNLVANLNADMVDGLHATASSNPLPNSLLALGVDGKFPASVIPPITTTGFWTDAGSYIYPNNAGSGFQITDTGNVFINGKVGIGTINPLRRLVVDDGADGRVPGVLEVTGSRNTGGGQEAFISVRAINTAPEPVGNSYRFAGFYAGDGSGEIQADFAVATTATSSWGRVAVYTNHPLIFETNSEERIRITNTGNVGINTAAPNAKLHVNKDSGANHTEVARFVAINPGAMPYITVGNSNTGGENAPTCGGGYFAYDNPTGTVRIGEHCNNPAITVGAGNAGIGKANPQAALDVNGDLSVNGPIYQRGSLLHADYVFEPDYKLESIDEHAKFMWQEKHLKAVPKAAKAEDGQEIVEVGARNKGILEELEKAHIYIAQLNERLRQLEAKLAGQPAGAR